MRVALVPGLVVLAILILAVIVAVPGLEAHMLDGMRTVLADILITLRIPVMTDHRGRFMSLL